MKEVGLIIKIPGEKYDRLIKRMKLDRDFRECEILEFPKGYGRLMILSEDAVKREQTFLGFSCQSWISDAGLSNATVAIIEGET